MNWARSRLQTDQSNNRTQLESTQTLTGLVFDESALERIEFNRGETLNQLVEWRNEQTRGRAAR